MYISIRGLQQCYQGDIIQNITFGSSRLLWISIYEFMVNKVEKILVGFGHFFLVTHSASGAQSVN